MPTGNWVNANTLAGPPVAGRGLAGTTNTVTFHGRCAAQGHRIEADDEHVGYMDGVSVWFCCECGDRIQMASVPTGDLRPRIKALVADLTALPPGASFPEDCAKALLVLLDDAKAATERMGDVVEMVTLANAIIRQRWP